MKKFKVTHYELYVPDTTVKVYSEKELYERYSSVDVFEMFGVDDLEVGRASNFSYDHYIDLCVERIE